LRLARDALWRWRLAGVFAICGDRKNHRQDAGAMNNLRSSPTRFLALQRSGLWLEMKGKRTKIYRGFPTMICPARRI
jgi:hypothetical protein